MTSRCIVTAIAILVLAGMIIAQAPPQGAGANEQRGGAGAPARGAQDAPGARRGGAPTGGGMGSAEIAPLIFEEHWTRAPMAQPITQANLGNQDLTLHLYGDQQVRKTYHPTEDYTYSGETKTNWALTVSDTKNYWNLAGTGKMMLRTRNSGWRFTHIVIKTADGKYYASEEGSGESSSWMNVEYILGDLHWRSLLMTDTPTNASNQRKPDPSLVPIIPLAKATPDLTKVEEVGFSDLMPGGWIPATTRVNAFALYGKKVPR
jgi:hypothetical protein